MKLALILTLIFAATTLAGCQSHTLRWAACAHVVSSQCSSLTPVAAVP